jgi:hypothetical protein
MPIQDAIAIATFAIAILGVVYAIGKRDSTLSELNKDINGLGRKVDDYDTRLDRLSQFYVRVDQRVMNLEENCFGEEKTNRLRESTPEKHYTNINDPWYSENSGIDL